MMYDVVIVGGGAAGFFTAINIVEQRPELKVVILERGNEVLSKVRISGGGRCNVTHAKFIPKDLSLNYPRGQKELLGPFHTFMTGDTMSWFEERGVGLKIEEDGRIFPKSNSSLSIIDCFLKESERLRIKIKKKHAVKEFVRCSDFWQVETNQGVILGKKLVVATGSNPKIWKQLRSLSHTITDAVPSLFTFNSADKRIKNLPGVSTEVAIEVDHTSLKSEGPLLITHWGFSGPAILKLSAWGALDLHKINYNFKLKVNWLPGSNKDEIITILKALRHEKATQLVINTVYFEIPKRLWAQLVVAGDITNQEKWADINNKKLQNLASQLTESIFKIQGKSTFKEEFVTAGGVDLKEIDFKTFKSKKQPDLYLAGEVLNIDAVTGGFNFQNAWTGGFLIARAISHSKL